MLVTVREQLKLLFTNTIFLSCICSWFCAQFLKTIIKLVYGQVHSIKELFEYMFWRTGSMPSSHSAIVSSLCTSIGFSSGINSDVFVLALCFFLVTIRDALGVRRANGIQARALNQIGTTLNEKSIIQYKCIKEVQGHNPLEVFIGILLGFFIGLAFAVL